MQFNSTFAMLDAPLYHGVRKAQRFYMAAIQGLAGHEVLQRSLDDLHGRPGVTQKTGLQWGELMVARAQQLIAAMVNSRGADGLKARYPTGAAAGGVASGSTGGGPCLGACRSGARDRTVKR